MHTADSCCGQKGKRKEESEWTSGYACSKCWSTEAGTECHCSLKQRQQGPLGCAGIAQSGGSTKPGDPDYTGPTVSKRMNSKVFTSIRDIDTFSLLDRHLCIA